MTRDSARRLWRVGLLMGVVALMYQMALTSLLLRSDVQQQFDQLSYTVAGN